MFTNILSCFVRLKEGRANKYQMCYADTRRPWRSNIRNGQVVRVGEFDDIGPERTSREVKLWLQMSNGY